MKNTIFLAALILATACASTGTKTSRGPAATVAKTEVWGETTASVQLTRKVKAYSVLDEMILEETRYARAESPRTISVPPGVYLIEGTHNVDTNIPCSNADRIQNSLRRVVLDIVRITYKEEPYWLMIKRTAFANDICDGPQSG